MEHTPGPWTATKHEMETSIGTYASFTIIGDEQKIVNVKSGFYVDEGQHSEADAKLIAAAPDLLEALKEAEDSMLGVRRESCMVCLTNLVDSDGEHYPGCSYPLVIAAIAKATQPPGGRREEMATEKEVRTCGVCHVALETRSKAVGGVPYNFAQLTHLECPQCGLMYGLQTPK